MIFAIAVLTLLGLVTVCYCIGLFIRRSVRGTGSIHLPGRVGWALAGALVLGFVFLIPLIGWVVVSLAVAAGFGAASAELWTRLRAA